MPGAAYDRYGLTGNPFRDLASESLSDVELYHVNQAVDETIRTIRDEVLEKENRAVIAITGDLGVGKTERLRVADADATQRKAFHVYFDISTKMPWVIQGLAQEFRRSAQTAGLVKAFGGPAWLRGLAPLEKMKSEGYDPIVAGRAIATALNESAPSFLLLNDLHNLVESREVDVFARTLQEITDAIRPGVLVMFTCYGSYVAWLTVNHPALTSRINRTFALTALSNDEATLLLAKKLLAKRIVEDLDPTYPFDSAAVAALNTAARGNPRRLLELADLALEYAATHRANRVDVDVVRLSNPTVAPRSPPATRPTSAQPRSPTSPPVVRIPDYKEADPV